MAKKTMFFVHCAATRPDWMEGQPAEKKMAEITRWHVKGNGWADNAYAYGIDRDGTIVKGRDRDNDGDVWEEIAAAAKGFNSVGIHVCLFGGAGSTANDKFEDHFTPEQDISLRKLIKEAEQYVDSPLWVRGHNEVANKACPGFQVAPWYKQVPVRGIAQSKTMQGAASAVVGGAGATFTGVAQLDGDAQVVFVVCMMLVFAALLYVLRARVKDWANGHR